MNLWLELEQKRCGDNLPLATVLNAIPWNADGLIGAIAQRHNTDEVLMLAWMNRAALDETLATGQVCYWSRSRQQLWRKGETSGNHQRLIEARLDCDGDAILLLVEQQGPACHTGRPNCFYNAIRNERVTVISVPQ
ncbi:phosphoribosyl-AMP cyclohydrolase [Pseudomonas rhizophila]|uniref:phosphoribosyl-AMP cyclohydrolase n=1 Tax=Pseudomonas rhizophila TaxID=2045200 RepID=UPI0030D720D3